MFTDKTVLVIDKNKLVVSRVWQKQIKSHLELEWNPETITQQFYQIKKQFGSSLFLLIDDVFVHTGHLFLSKNPEPSRQWVQEQAEALFQEDLGQTYWDFKIEKDLRDNNQKDGFYYQVLAINKSFYTMLTAAIKPLALKIEAIEPISQSLARQLSSNQNETFAIVYHQSHYVLVICLGDIVVQVKKLGTTIDTLTLIKNLQATETNYGLKIERLLWPSSEIIPVDLNQPGVLVKQYEYQPQFGILQKTDLKGSDSEVLNLNFQNQDNNKNPNTTKFNMRWLIIPIVLGLFIVLFLKVVNTAFITNPKTEPTPPPTPTVAVKKQYKISILNGNGIEGAASEAKELLNKNNYQVISLGNADNYNYQQTRVSHKKGVDAQFLQKLVAVLEEEYTVEVNQEFLAPSEKVDVEIVLGQ